MFCEKCGSEYKEGAKFCPKCGNPLESISPANNEEISQPDSDRVSDTDRGKRPPNKRRIALIIIIAAIIAVAIVIIAISSTRHSSTKTALSTEEQMALGARYLEDGEYEEAAEVLRSVLAVDPNMQAYRYLADAYLDLDETNLAGDVYEEAVEFALDTYEQTEELPDGTEELYDDVLTYESDYEEEVPRTNELKDLITPSVSEPKEDDDEGAVIEQGAKDDTIENSEQTSEANGVNTAYIDDDGNIALNITTYDESYFRDNNIHLKRLEPNGDDVYDFSLETYGTIDSLNDVWVSVQTTIQIDVVEDEEEGYVDSILTVKDGDARILDLLEPEESYNEYLYVGEHVRDEVSGDCHICSAAGAYDFYTGSNLATKKGFVINVAEETTESDMSPMGIIVNLPDGTTGHITVTYITEKDEDGNSIIKIIIKHPASYDGVVFKFDGSYKVDKEEEDRRNREAEENATEPTLSYAQKINYNLDHQSNCDFYGSSKTAEDLGLS